MVSAVNLSANMSQFPLTPAPTVDNFCKAIQENQLVLFGQMLEDADINNYVEGEGSRVLLSGLLLFVLTNPHVENGEQFITAVLSHKPNLNLPIDENDPSLSCSAALKSMQISLIYELNQPKPTLDLEPVKICLERLELIMDYCQAPEIVLYNA